MPNPFRKDGVRLTAASAPSTPEQLLLTAIVERSWTPTHMPFRLDAEILSRTADCSVEYSPEAALMVAVGLEQGLHMPQPSGGG